jgi:hypothetical protein
MPYFLAVYSRDAIITVKEMSEGSREHVERHPNGQLIYAIVEADNIEEATSRAQGLLSFNKEKEREESD